MYLYGSGQPTCYVFTACIVTSFFFLFALLQDDAALHHCLFSREIDLILWFFYGSFERQGKSHLDKKTKD